MKTSSKTIRLGVLLAVCVALTAGIWWLRREPSLESSGKQVFEAMVQGDGRTLLRYALPEEISANNLTREKISRLYHELILPRLAVSPTLAPAITNGGNGYVDLSNDKFAVMVVDTVNGPRASITTKLLEAWSDEYHRRNNLKWSVLSRCDAVIEGVTKDRKVLDELGIRSLYELDIMSGKVKEIPVATLAAEYRKWRDQLSNEVAANR